MPRLSKENGLLDELPQPHTLRSLASKNMAIAKAQAMVHQYPRYYRLKVRLDQLKADLQKNGRQYTIFDVLD